MAIGQKNIPMLKLILLQFVFFLALVLTTHGGLFGLNATRGWESKVLLAVEYTESVSEDSSISPWTIESLDSWGWGEITKFPITIKRNLATEKEDERIYTWSWCKVSGKIKNSTL